MEAKRVLWLLNHKTLMLFEVPMLRSLGYEVYIPKIPPFDVSVAVDWESDKLLSIPQEDLDILNKVDFYEKRITPDVARIVNRYFQTAMFIHTPATIESMVDYFKGALVLRAYGRHAATGSYSDVIISELGLFTMTKLESTGSRFVFAESYKGLSDIECRFFQDHTLYAPIGMPDASLKDGWTGEKEKVLFPCPRIKMSGLYEGVYKEFLKNFKGIPYAVSGTQPIAVNSDKNVLGFLPIEEYEKLYTLYRCMFYPNQEKNQLSYEPLEAIRNGMPVVFMAEGMLDKLGGESLAGRCRTVNEARNKVKRLVDGDKKLANQIRKEQSVLLEKFAFDYCFGYWKTTMDEIEKRRSYKQIPLFGKKKKRIAVILPEGFTGGILDYTINLVYALKSAIKSTGDLIEIIFGYVDHKNFSDQDYFKPIRNMGIPIRKFKWEALELSRAQDILSLKGIKYALHETDQLFAIPNDGISFFSDCDFLLFTSDRFPYLPFLLQPYGVIEHDFIQRLVPAIFDSVLLSVYQGIRRAKAVYTTTPVTIEHAIQYGGVSRDRIHLIPLFFSTVENYESEDTCRIINQPYFLWSTNPTPHKMHLQAFQALSHYYASGGQLLCCITGSQTEKMSPRYKTDDVITDYIKEIHMLLSKDTLMMKNIRFLGNLPKKQYSNVLANATFLFHPGFADNGNMTAFDAAWKGVPTLSNDYKAMRYYDEILRLNMRFFDVKDIDSIVDALFDIERNLDSFVARLPSTKQLMMHTVQSDTLSTQIYQTIIAFSGIFETGE